MSAINMDWTGRRKLVEVMDLAQLASYLKMSQASLYHLLAAGKIPGTKVGKQWRFARPTVDEWLQGSKQRSADILVV
jgi:excisionase family DNA binding protein